MNFNLINSKWDRKTQSYNYLVCIKSKFFKKLVTITTPSPGCTGDKLFKHQAQLLDIFETYPASGTQESLALLDLRLKQCFALRDSEIIVHGSTIEISSASVNIFRGKPSDAICLKARLETKNVAPDKIRRYDKQDSW